MNRFVHARRLILGLALSLSVVGVSAQSVTVRYVQKFRPVAEALSAEYGIPASIILAVAVMESGSGTSLNCRELQNHFGIVGPNKLARHTRYRQYASGEESYRHFCQVLSRKPYYARLRGTTDPQVWTAAIAKSGYSTQPLVWQQRVNGVIKTNRL